MTTLEQTTPQLNNLEMFDIQINTNSKTVMYKQLISEFSAAIKDGRLKAGEIVPSMNELADQLGISKETVKRAYGILRERGLLVAQQGKGFYVSDDNQKNNLSILLLFDKFSTYKQEIVRGFNTAITEKCELTIQLFNQDISVFEYLINENEGKYDYYVISPHFPLDKKSQEKAEKLIRRIPNHKLIMIDHWMSEIPGNYGAVYQDFKKDAYEGLTKNIEVFRNVKKLNILTLPSSLYAPLIEEGIKKFCTDNNIKCSFSIETPEKIEQGDVFLILNSQLDSGLISLVDKANEYGMQVGQDYYIISYNDSPIDKVVLNGLTTISTDFLGMGREVAEMINSKKMFKKHIPFGMNRRFTF